MKCKKCKGTGFVLVSKHIEVVCTHCSGTGRKE